MQRAAWMWMVAALVGGAVADAQQFPAGFSFLPTNGSAALADGFQLNDGVRGAVPGQGGLLLTDPDPLQQTCRECNRPRQFWSGAYQLVIVQLIPWSVNRFVRGLEFAEVSPATWWTNLENPWLWDNNHFLNNQFSHPYHGSLYFNAGRANGTGQ